jgi:Protein of unknown function (DUF3237)
MLSLLGEDVMKSSARFVRLAKRMMISMSLSLAAAIAIPISLIAGGPTTSIQTEYLMTLHAQLNPPQVIDKSLVVVNVPSGGWVEGPRIKGKILAPAGDWLRVMPSGIMRIDVRGTIQTDDGEFIYTSYNGVIQCGKEQIDKLNAGEELKAGDCHFITAPTFETKSEKYAWLNAVQAVGKMISLKRGDHITYDIFAAK